MINNSNLKGTIDPQDSLNLIIIRGTKIQNCKLSPQLELCRNPPVCVLPVEICNNCQASLNDQTDKSSKWVIPVVTCTVLVAISFLGMLYIKYRRFKERTHKFKDISIYNIPSSKMVDSPSLKQEVHH